MEEEVEPPYTHVFDVASLASDCLPRAARNCVLIGYPISKNKDYCHVERRATVTPTIFTGCGPVPDGDYAKFGFGNADHVLLQQDLRHGSNFDGRRQAFPSPRGMSGSPLYAYVPAMKEHTHRFVVVGVFHRYRNAGKLFIASDIGCALDAIEQLNEAANVQ